MTTEPFGAFAGGAGETATRGDAHSQSGAGGLDVDPGRLRQLFEAVRAGIIIHRADGTMRYANGVAAKILGLSREALEELCLEHSDWQMIHEDGSPVDSADHPSLTTLRTGAPVRDAVRGIFPGDPERFRWLLLHTEPLGVTEHDRPAEVLITFTDITAQKRAEVALAESEARYRVLFESGSDAVCLIEAGTGLILDANQAASALYGYTHEELCQLHNYDLSHQPKQTQQAVAEHRPLVVLRWHRKKDGSVFPVEITGSYFPWRGRDVHVASVRDITERLRMEEELGAIFEMSEDLICIADLESATFLKVNPGSQRLLGWTEAELLTPSFLSFIHPDDLAPTRAILEERLKRGESVLRFVNRYRHKDGGYRWLDWVAHPVAERGISFAIARDITEAREAELERERLEAQLRQAQKMEAVGRLAGGVAHDFNNLLTGIVGNLSFAQMCHPGDPMIPESLDEALNAAHRATELTRQLLTFSRRQIMRARVHDLSAVVEGILQMLPRIIGEDVILELRPPPAPLPVLADAGQLEQVILNLAVNARDAMPKGGTIRFETLEIPASGTSGAGGADAPGRVALRISDTGAGISPEHLDRIFEPFFTTKEVGRGTGLGLSTVFGIVKQHEGDIEVTSTLGSGSSFLLSFPRATAAPSVEVRAPATVEAAGGHELILLVEDEPVVRRVASRSLTRAGYRVLEAEDGPAALALLEGLDQPPDLLLTDVIMPGMDGRALAQVVRARLPGIRVIYSSGYSEDVIAHHGVLEDGLELLPKPYDPATLTRTVRRILDRKLRA